MRKSPKTERYIISMSQGHKKKMVLLTEKGKERIRKEDKKMRVYIHLVK